MLEQWGWEQPRGWSPGSEAATSHLSKPQVCKSKKFTVN